MEIASIKSLVKLHYKLEVSVKSLVGYEDQNYLLTTTTGEQYILKISNAKQNIDILKAQYQVLNQLKKAAIPHYQFPEFIPSKAQEFIIPIADKSDGAYLRMLNFIKGAFFAEVTHTPTLLQSLGNFLAKMNQALKAEQIPTLEHRNIIWDLKNFLQCEAYTQYIKNPKQRRIVDYYLLQYKNFLEDKVASLRKAIIHNDANDWNILVQDGAVSGIIDFGDLCYSQLINELAIALTYTLMGKEDPLRQAEIVIASYHEVLPLEEKELEVLYYLIAVRLCISVCMSAYSSRQSKDNEYINISEDGAWSLLEKWISINPILAANRFKACCGFPAKDLVDKSHFLANRFQHISAALSVSYQQDPIKMEQAAFQYMYDDQGKTYLDGVNNICHVGHCHPKVVKAAQKQIARLNTNTRYLYDSLNEYATAIAAKFPAQLNKVFFVNSGSAATDLAYRMATHFTQRKHMLVVDHAYHGNTNIGIQLSPYKYEGKGGMGKAAHIYKTPAPDCFRGIYRYDDPEAGTKYALLAKDIIQQANAANQPIAAFICESILGCGGQIVLPPNYLKTIYTLIRQHGGLCIVDEVQVGFGRVGSHFWAYEMQDVVPDIVILGKPMGNGHPIGAVVTTDEIAASFDNGMEFFSSFGGNPVSCEIGKAVLEVIEEEALQAHALDLGDFLLEEFRKLQKRHPIIGDVRGSGLFIGLELVKDLETLAPAQEAIKIIIHQLKEKQILLSIDGPLHNVLKFKPPLSFSKENAVYLVEQLDHCLKNLAVTT